MHETDDDVAWLQALIDRTFARANPHLAKIVKPERRLTARQVVTYLQGTKHVAFATVNERGEPRVAPLDGVFVRGRFTVSTGARAARLRHLRANPACSAAHVVGDDIGSSPFSWGDGVVFMRVEPTSMWAYAFHPENFPE